MLDIIAKIFLSFSHDTIIIPLIVLGYIWVDRDVFYHAVCLILINMVFNFALKITFRIPLTFTASKEEFAFPSGHMQNAVVFYGWIIYKTQNILCKILLLLLLIGIAVSLVYFGYHNYYDILGAIFFAVILIIGYYLTLTRFKILLPLIVLLLVFIFMIYINFTYKIENHLWIACYGLPGIISAERFFGKKSINNKIIDKVFASILCFSMIFIIKYLFTTNLFYSLSPFLRQVQWTIIGFCIPSCMAIIHIMKVYVFTRNSKS